ncbi:MAG: tetratricopeptide repeat protein [Candidatus Nanoarchaeia archaeon]|nr:tetratricopeptide repeat protein [Candidatus Nanoarchaeia archaeon]
MGLEDQLMDEVRNGTQIDIERSLLIVSGCDTEEKVAEYRTKLDELDRRYHEFIDKYDLSRLNTELKAEGLHLHLWMKGGQRFESKIYRLTDNIDGQMLYNGANPVGNCVGLSSLYIVLGLRNNFPLGIYDSPEHTSVALILPERTINIESTDIKGFNRKPEKFARQAGVNSLLSGVFCSKGNKLVEVGQYEKAEPMFEMAIMLDDKNITAINSMGCFAGDCSSHEEAIEWFTKAISLCSQYALPYFNRSRARTKIGDLKGAEEDMNRYRKLVVAK